MIFADREHCRSLAPERSRAVISLIHRQTSTRLSSAMIHGDQIAVHAPTLATACSRRRSDGRTKVLVSMTARIMFCIVRCGSTGRGELRSVVYRTR